MLSAKNTVKKSSISAYQENTCESLSNTRIPELHYDIVAYRAYCKAQKKGFEPSHELDDWLEAERECLIDSFG